MLGETEAFMRATLGANWRQRPTSEIVNKDAHGCVLQRLLGMLATAEVNTGTEGARKRAEMWASLAKWSQTRIEVEFAPHAIADSTESAIVYDHRIEERSAIWRFIQQFGSEGPPTAVYSPWLTLRDVSTSEVMCHYTERRYEGTANTPPVYQVCASGCELQHVHGVYTTWPGCCINGQIAGLTGEAGRAYVDTLLKAERAMRG